MTIVWNSENAAHLLRRAGFGPTATEVADAVADGMEKTIDGLFKKDKTSDALPSFAELPTLEQLQQWWLRRMVKTTSPLVEKMTLFWHNHFATGMSKVVDGRVMHRQNHMLRKRCLGRFFDLALAVAKDPAMMIWLDTVVNKKSSPNQNFARELMELFTCGVYDAAGQPNYTEDDVKEGARAFTGWSLHNFKFTLNVLEHDYGVKTFKGITGNLEGDAIVQILVAELKTARRIAWKLFSFFARPVALGDPLLAPLIQAYQQNGGSIRAMLDALFRMDEFYAPASIRSRVKSPVEFLVGALRQLHAKVAAKKGFANAIGFAVQKLGQSIFDPPSVFGWDEGLAWINSNTMLRRTKVAEDLADARKEFGSPFSWSFEDLLGPADAWPLLDKDAVIDACAGALQLPPLTPAARAALHTYLDAGEHMSVVPFVLTPESADRKVRGLVALLLSSPEYQLA